MIKQLLKSVRIKSARPDRVTIALDFTQSDRTMTNENSVDNTLRERLEQGRRLKAAKGGYAGYGSPAFGQRSIDGELVEDPIEQQTIEIIRRHHKSGKSLQQIADWLNHHGYTTKRGQQWKRISVKRVLDRLYGKTLGLSGIPPS